MVNIPCPFKFHYGILHRIEIINNKIRCDLHCNFSVNRVSRSLIKIHLPFLFCSLVLTSFIAKNVHFVVAIETGKVRTRQINLRMKKNITRYWNKGTPEGGTEMSHVWLRALLASQSMG